MISTRENSKFVYQRSVAILLAESSSSKSGKSFILGSDFFLHVAKAYDMRLTALLPLLRKSCYGFICIVLKNSSSLAGFESAVFGSNGKHANHYTTEATKWEFSINICFSRSVPSRAHSCVYPKHCNWLILPALFALQIIICLVLTCFCNGSEQIVILSFRSLRNTPCT
jgi:hypothetical protein